ncbi:MAG: T9SS type A sorting domain-containing protein, partial [Flavobacteriaceae bacterium]|nr:T9SS type A sorting domain-containing protein [Flavobacteriaceae bacterium]
DLTAMESEITIDVSDFANATYFIVINASQGTTTKQLIVNN